MFLYLSLFQRCILEGVCNFALLSTIKTYQVMEVQIQTFLICAYFSNLFHALQKQIPLFLSLILITDVYYVALCVVCASTSYLNCYCYHYRNRNFLHNFRPVISILKMRCCESLYYMCISAANADLTVSAHAPYNTLDRAVFNTGWFAGNKM